MGDHDDLIRERDALRRSNVRLRKKMEELRVEIGNTKEYSDRTLVLLDEARAKAEKYRDMFIHFRKPDADWSFTWEKML